MAELIAITNRSTPKGQVSWFRKHFALDVEHDCHGVIITKEVFQQLVAKKYGLGIAANDPGHDKRPSVKLIKKNA